MSGARVVDRYTLELAEELTGVRGDDIARAARIYARPDFGGSCLIWGMGVTQHTNGTANAHGLLNLALAAGQLGKPGSGVSPLRGQNNVQGCGDSGCLPSDFPGYQGIAANVGKFQEAWGNHPLPSKRGMVVTDMVEAAIEGRLKAMYVTGENPLLSEPDLHHAEQAFSKLDFLVVQDIFMHETAQLADVVLPAASFAEKDGTFTNSERRVQRVRKVIDPVGDSRPDWEIICDLARRMSRLRGLGVEAEFEFGHPSEIWDEMAALTPIVSGISYERLDAEGGIQWPCPTPDHPGTRFLYETSFPRGIEGEVRAVRPGPAGGGAARQAVPADPEHGPQPIPLARRHHHPSRLRAAREVPGAADSHQRRGRRALRRGGRGVGGPVVSAGAARGAHHIHGEDALRGGLRAVREAKGPRRELPDEFGVRPQLEDPGVQGLRRAHREALQRQRPHRAMSAPKQYGIITA